MKYLKNKFILLTVCSIALLSLNGCDMFKMAVTSEPSNQGEYRIYENKLHRIRIKYPANWFMLENPNKNADVHFFPANRYKENKVALTVIDKSKYNKIETQGEKTTLSGLPAIKNIIIIDDTFRPSDINPDSPLFIFELVVNAFSPLTDLLHDDHIEKILHIRTVKNDKIYMINYITYDQKYYNDYINIVNDMVESFEIY